jgi:hypothetical protein
MLQEAWSALGGDGAALERIRLEGEGELPSVFAVSDLAAASVGAAALSVGELIATRGGVFPAVAVDRRLASMWFWISIRPQRWQLPPIWDVTAGDYPTADGWIKLHTNVPSHRAAALGVLRVAASKEAVAEAVRGWKADRLERAIVERGGCAAAMRPLEAWAAHPQGRAVASEPLFHRAAGSAGGDRNWAIDAGRPLAGVRVLDLTRVLAGPVSTRFLAGFGAQVLRIDPPEWDEPAIVPEVTLGKRCARLDFASDRDREILTELVRRADVLVHGYRPGTLARRGFDSARMQELSPGLVEVSLDAYGWSGPWSGRRGFDSLVQMSSGIAAEGMRRSGSDRPRPLPVQALDHGTGYFMAAAAVRGLTQRLRSGQGSIVRISLARTATLLIERSREFRAGPTLAPETAADLSESEELTHWGVARRLRPPVAIAGSPMSWSLPASPLGSAPPRW